MTRPSDPDPARDPVRFDNLSLADLIDWQMILSALISAGQSIAGAGYTPRFALYPGAAPRLWLTDASLPHAPRDTGYHLWHGGDDLPAAPAEAAVEAPAEAPAPEPVPVPPGPMVVREADRGPEAAAPEAPNADTPNAGLPWHEADRLKAARLRRGGLGLKEIARELGRPYTAVAVYFKDKLPDWRTYGCAVDEAPAVDDSAPAPDCQQAALATAPAPEPAPEAEPVPESGLPPDPWPEAAPVPETAPGLPPRLRAIEAALPDSVDPELDLEIMEAIVRGAHLSEVSADLGLDSDFVKRRWNDLRAPLMQPGDKALSLEAQHSLGDVLRWRAAVARAKTTAPAPRISAP